MTGRYTPPPPTYEHSQQGHDRKIADFSNSYHSSLATPGHLVSKAEHDREAYERDDDKLEDLPSKLGALAPVQSRQVHKNTYNTATKDGGWYGHTNVRTGGRVSRPLPPSPASLPQNHGKLADGDTKHSVWSSHYEYLDCAPPPPFVPHGQRVQDAASSTPSFPPTLHNYPANHRYQQQTPGGYHPTSQSTRSYAQTYSSVSQTQAHLNFNPLIAYSGSVSEPADLSAGGDYISPTALYSSAVSSHLQPPPLVPPGHRYGKRHHMHSNSTVSLAESLLSYDGSTMSHSTTYSQGYPTPSLLPPQTYQSRVARSPSPMPSAGYTQRL